MAAKRSDNDGGGEHRRHHTFGRLPRSLRASDHVRTGVALEPAATLSLALGLLQLGSGHRPQLDEAYDEDISR